MKAVNLLPPTERPRAVRPAPPNASLAVLVVLGALVLGIAGLVLSKNQATGKRNAIATANQEKQAADQRAQGLQAFGDFGQIKETRVQSITDLATKRFDWERFMREIALVLPDKVWVSNVSAGGTGSSGAATPTAADPQTAAASAGSRSVQITGCAPTQKAVAATMVRLRSMHDAGEVDLKDSGKSDDNSGGATPASTDGASASDTGCGDNYEFNATVAFETPTQGSTQKKSVEAPARLGGGS